LIFDKCLYLWGRLRLTTARWLSACMLSRALATTTASSCIYYLSSLSHNLSFQAAISLVLHTTSILQDPLCLLLGKDHIFMFIRRRRQWSSLVAAQLAGSVVSLFICRTVSFVSVVGLVINFDKWFVLERLTALHCLPNSAMQ